MVTFKKFQAIAMSFPEVKEEPHFEKTSFRIKKKIFASYDEKNKRACIKLSAKDQDVFFCSNPTIIYPVPNAWGKQGWTFIELKKVSTAMLLEALIVAYCEVAPKKLADHVRPS